ncbi:MULTISPECIES: restriction endonuclease subunit S [Methanothermobacter]|uniref:Type I restriction enzyme S subunit n=1 Tax=Methanothermobacter defluvii TaxID=49339 RepID=A0A371NDA0_9EURY|nr:MULTISPECIES: restriction endonuclease subunit S [Methanothermobacter]REE28414.1 type I restriction enzyme S subunit [Methanothermobacter defluvii]WBF09456.1 restriction endonuclease subunit S [Methanothermobacter marburgensis]
MNTVEFKDSPVGRIPVDWDVVSLGEVVDQRRESIQPAGEGKNNFVGLEHIRSGETKLCEYVSDEGIRSTKYRFYTGDILYGKLRPYLDKAVLADINGICSTDLIVLTPSDRIIPEFLIYFIHTNQFIQRAVSTTSGTNHPRTSWKAISKFRMALPPLEEQKRISEILQDVDGAIEKVNKEIGVTEKLKRGLMQRLLMEGINHTEFKDSPVGRIPVDWDVVKLGDLFTFKNGKRPPVLNEGEIPIYGANGKMGLTSNYLKTKDKALIFGRVGSSGEVHLSKGCVWVSDNAIYTESYDSKRVNVHFMFYLIKFKDLKRFATKTTHPIITQTFINNFKVPLPPLEEQKRISEILQDVDRRLELLTERKVKLENIKRGLMNDLLTGKRRVRITS